MFDTFKKAAAAAVLAVTFSAGAKQAEAAFVTIDEAGMDAIFSQASFGNNPIDIIIGEITEIVAPNLLDITTDAEIFELFAMHQGPANEPNFYFVDSISSCGGFNPNIVGCGETPGNDFVVESDFAAGRNNAELLAHELAHNLGLPHRDGGLMDPFINGETDLNAEEVARIFQSPAVQRDADDNFFIRINPVLVLAEPIAAVPLPAGGLLLMGALGGLGLARRKRRAA